MYAYIYGDLASNCTELIEQGNIRSLVEDPFQAKGGRSDADLPDLALSITNVNGPTFASSSSHKFTVVCDVLVSTGDLSQKTVNRLLWWLMTRVAYMSQNPGIFTYQGAMPMKKITFRDGKIGLTKSAVENLNVKGFSSLSVLEIEVIIPNTLFVPVSGSNI